MSIWFNSDTTTGQLMCIFVGDCNTAGLAAAIGLNRNNNGTLAFKFAGTTEAVTGTDTYTVDTNHNFTATKTAGAVDGSTEIFLDGISITIVTTSANTPNITNFPTEVSRFGICDLFFNGHMANAVIWDVQLSDNEIKALAHGVNPFPIRNSNMVTFYEIWGNQSPELDISQITGDGTVTGTTKVAGFQTELLENYL